MRARTRSQVNNTHSYGYMLANTPWHTPIDNHLGSPLKLIEMSRCWISLQTQATLFFSHCSSAQVLTRSYHFMAINRSAGRLLKNRWNFQRTSVSMPRTQRSSTTASSSLTPLLWPSDVSNCLQNTHPFQPHPTPPQPSTLPPARAGPGWRSADLVREWSRLGPPH